MKAALSRLHISDCIYYAASVDRQLSQAIFNNSCQTQVIE